MGTPALMAASRADCMTLQGFTVGVTRPGKGAETISSSAAYTLSTPGEGGGGGGGGATVGGHAGGPEQRTSHWLRHDRTFEPASGPACPTPGQPQEPVPANSHGAHEDLVPPLASYEMNMHFEPVAEPLAKHWLWLMAPDVSEHT